MSVLPQLERDLIDAARRRRPATLAASGPRAGLRRLRLPLLAAGCLLASATIALAASGVIPIGPPVKPRGLLSPNVGVGTPLPGGSRVLPLRVRDPYGGLPWGMRVVQTTRGEVCVQVGRIENGQIGELGLDGAFNDDGRFHPIPANAQAEYFRRVSKHGEEGFSPIGGCQLAGSASTDQALGDERNAGVGEAGVPPLSHQRDLYWGLLGPSAVSVSFHAGGRARTVNVVPGLGAYLVVTRALHSKQADYGGSSLGTPGDLPAGDGLAFIAYRLDGKLCERGASTGPHSSVPVAHPCPTPHWPSGPAASRDLHVPIHAHLSIHDRLVTGVQVSFTAPLAVTSARYYYAANMPIGPCMDGRSRIVASTGDTLDRDVVRGKTVHLALADPFVVGSSCHPGSNTISVVYEAANGGGSTIVGKVTVHLPAGTKPAPHPGFGFSRRLSRLARLSSALQRMGRRR